MTSAHRPMSVFAKKIATVRRVARESGWRGMYSVISGKVNVRKFVQPPYDYARLAPSALTLMMRHGKPKLFVNAIGAGIGDDLLLTAMLRELKQRDRNNTWVTTRNPVLFLGNKDVEQVVRPFDRFDHFVKQFGVPVVYPWYTSYNPAYDRDDPIPEQHIISVMCQKAGITGLIALRPYLTLTKGELQGGAIVDRQIAVQSSGLNAKHSMMNKNWSLDKYQGVINALKSRYNFVQVGSKADPALEGVTDLRGQTGLRETAAVLARSQLFLGQVGFLMHLARAVDCRSVIVYGGRESPAQSGYPCNTNLYSAIPCSPCWRLNSCPYDRACLQMIGADEVAAAVERQIAQVGAPLECDTSVITQADIERNLARHEAAVLAHKQAWIVLYQ